MVRCDGQSKTIDSLIHTLADKWREIKRERESGGGRKSEIERIGEGIKRMRGKKKEKANMF